MIFERGYYLISKEIISNNEVYKVADLQTCKLKYLQSRDIKVPVTTDSLMDDNVVITRNFAAYVSDGIIFIWFLGYAYRILLRDQGMLVKYWNFSDEDPYKLIIHIVSGCDMVLDTRSHMLTTPYGGINTGRYQNFMSFLSGVLVA